MELSTEFGTRIESLLKELVNKSNNEAHLKCQVDLSTQIAPLQSRLARLEAQAQNIERRQSTISHLIIQVLDALRSFEKLDNSYEQDVVAQEHATVTINDVQRFLMQRNAP